MTVLPLGALGPARPAVPLTRSDLEAGYGSDGCAESKLSPLEVVIETGLGVGSASMLTEPGDSR